MAQELRNLFLADIEEFEHFYIYSYSKTYYNIFVFTSLGVNYDRGLAKRNYVIYMFWVQAGTNVIDNLVSSGAKREKFIAEFLW